jgi:hypothetical protein
MLTTTLFYLCTSDVTNNEWGQASSVPQWRATHESREIEYIGAPTYPQNIIKKEKIAKKKKSPYYAISENVTIMVFFCNKIIKHWNTCHKNVTALLFEIKTVISPFTSFDPLVLLSFVVFP